MTCNALLDLEIGTLRQKLLNYGRRHMHDEAAVEDLVQETLATIYASPQQFRGDSQASTYAIGILRHKMLDLFRAQRRHVPLTDGHDDDASSNGDTDSLQFSNQAHVNTAYSLHIEPERELERRQLGQALALALNGLPAHYRQVFMLREMAGLETEVIAEQMGVSVNHVWVMLHRARKKLQAQLISLAWAPFASAAALS